ncbi:protease-associated domain-containing protein 1-like [Actinia tenebrosa]|uniref:Protease-associated domain-containing protein 1-like n=1 Tax=Actinia tenebrosa TaxID=6105 RepID=A0A6P8ICW2_ACTTE|nr:protease-associated domain-containing protein 1-like [Actinia tenebrosa]
MELRMLLIISLIISCLLEICSTSQRVFTTTDFMMFESNALVYFEVLKPDKIKYIFKLRPAKDFGSLFKIQFNRIRLVATEPLEACQPLTNGWAMNGAIALVARGGCSFVTKCNIVEQFGAVAVFVADNVNDNADAMVDMVHDGTSREVHIPAGFLLGTDGYHIREAIKEAKVPEAIISIPVNVTTHPDLYTRQPPWSYW